MKINVVVILVSFLALLAGYLYAVSLGLVSIGLAAILMPLVLGVFAGLIVKAAYNAGWFLRAIFILAPGLGGLCFWLDFTGVAGLEALYYFLAYVVALAIMLTTTKVRVEHEE